MKTKYIYSIFLTFIIGTLLFSAFTVDDEEDQRTNKEIIKFSHSLHGDITDCASCHAGVESSTSLSERLLPDKEVCAGCHDVDDDENCGLCHYEGVYEALLIKKSDLIFDHRFHIADQGKECTECHTGFEGIDYSLEATNPNPPMENCFGCHDNNSVASNVCESCHIVTVDLLPSNHKTVDFFDTHKITALQSGANCAMCHDRSYCEACHVATIGIDENNTEKNFYAPFSPHTFTDGVKQQQITLVHDLNYRYTHGVDARGKDSECQTCHQVESFCSNCHNPDGSGDYAAGGIVPFSHTQLDFVTPGVGSGGGQHALLARRDIESCSSCHDVQGGDPNCLICHNDTDGIKGTNPRTHETGFMLNENGDWHSSDASVCYNCHTGSSASTGIPGTGFCGYCHGAL